MTAARPAPAAPAGLIVIAKEPVPGRVKTRLTPAYTPAEAAVLAEAALADTLAAVALTGAGRRVLALDGEPGPWLPTGFTVIPQRGGGLDERLACAFDDAGALGTVAFGTGPPGAGGEGPLVLIGMDTPQVTAGLLDEASRALGTHDAVFGPAADGGFWLLGLARPDPALLRGVPMSRPDTGRLQLARLRAAGLDVALLPALTDVDTPAAAGLVAGLAPRGRFAAAVRRLGDRTVPA